MTGESSAEEKAQMLVENLASGWNGGRPVFARLMRATEGCGSPFESFQELRGTHRLERVFAGEAARDLNAAFDSLQGYLSSTPWMDTAVGSDPRVGILNRLPIAYFCAEFGLEDWLSIYSGGLGILAGDVLKEAGDLGVPLVAMGLFYRRGFFNQHLDECGYQQETYPTLDPHKLPMRPVFDGSGGARLIEIPMAGRTVKAMIWKLEVGRVPLYLLDTDVPQNESNDDRAITASLYGGASETRIRQELVLGIGGVRALRALNIEPSIYSMNEGHAAFLGLELLLDARDRESHEEALTNTKNRIVYTNHTVVPAGNDIFPRDLVTRYLGPYAAFRGLPEEDLLNMAGTEGFSMAVLAFNLSGKANAVSHIHAEAIKSEPAWSRFPVEAVTNGVHVPTWLGPHISDLFDRYLPGWRQGDVDWNGVERIPPEEIWNAHAHQRRAMIQFVNGSLETEGQLGDDVLTVVWARRFAEYKRADLITSDMARLETLMAGRERSIQLIISGKAHPKDEGGKRMLQKLLHQLGSHPIIATRFSFVQDYTISVAQSLVHGADVWLNTPRKPLEASGTSGMKSAVNGGLQLTVTDGWAGEVEWDGIGWPVDGKDDGSDSRQVYEHLEQSVAPAFYTRDEIGVPQEWVRMMKRTMAMSLKRYSARRMLLEYLDKLYLPLLETQETSERGERPK